jgi:hypothetical protein
MENPEEEKAGISLKFLRSLHYVGHTSPNKLPHHLGRLIQTSALSDKTKLDICGTSFNSLQYFLGALAHAIN